MNENGVSPVVGIILLTAVTVALVGLAAFFVFDIDQSSNSRVGAATVTAEYESESSIDVQLVKQSSAEKVIVRSSLGTEYTLGSAGESVTLLNQDGNQTPVVLAENGGERTVLRDIPPQLFTPDIVVSQSTDQGQYISISNALSNARDGDIIVLKRDVYHENIDVSTPNITLVGETGTVIADSTTDASVINVQAENVRISNIKVNASSSQGGTPAEYGVDGDTTTEIVSTTVTNANTSNTNGGISRLQSTRLVPPEQINTTRTIATENSLVKNDLLAYGGYDTTAYIQNPKTGATNQSLSPDTDKIFKLAWSPNNTHLAIGTASGNVYVYNATDWTKVTTLTQGSRIRGLTWKPDGSQIAYGGGSGDVHIHNTSDYALETTLTSASNRVYQIDYKPDGSQIAYGSEDTNVYIHNTTNYSLTKTITRPNNHVYDLEYRPDGQKIAYTGFDNLVYIHDTADYSFDTTLQQASNNLLEVTYNPNSTRIAYTGNEGTVWIHNVSDYSVTTTLTQSPGYTNALSWSPNGSKIAYGGSYNSDFDVHIHDTTDYSLNTTLQQASDRVMDISWREKPE